MRFAFLIFKYFPFGGVQRDMLRIARALITEGHTVEVFTLSWQGEMPVSGMQVHLIKVEGFLNHVRYANFIPRAQAEIAKTDFDLIVGFNRMPGLDAYYAADPCFVERAHTQRSAFYRMLKRYSVFAMHEKAVFAKDANCHILCISPKEKPVFQRWYGTQDPRFHMIPPSLNAAYRDVSPQPEAQAYLRQEFGFGADDKILLLVGSGFKTKGLDRAIRALSSLPQPLVSRTRLLVVGQDNPRHFNKLAKKLDVADAVRISAGRNDISMLMRGADLLIHPAYRENTGLVLLEAMASCLPVLVTAVCGYAYHVEQANGGKVMNEPFQQSQLNAMLAKMLLSADAHLWGLNGRRYAEAMLTANNGDFEAKVLVNLANAKKDKQEYDIA